MITDRTNLGAFYLSDEHIAAVKKAGINGGTIAGREEDVSSFVLPLAMVAKATEDENLDVYLDGFMLGYCLRGIDSILDFSLSEKEIAGSITQSYAVRLISDLRETFKKVTGDDK